MVPFDPNGNRQAGADWIRGLRNTYAQAQAGRALAAGDQGGAQRALFNSGDLGGGLALQDRQREQANDARQLEWATEDRQIARDDRAKAQQLNTTRQVITALSRASREGGDVGLLLNEFRPTFIAMGTTPEQFDSVASQVRENPAILDQFGHIIDREIQVINLGNGGWASVDKNTGQRVAGTDAYIRPTVVGDVALGPDGQPLFDARRPEYFETTDGGAPVIVGVDPRTGRASETWRGEAEGPSVRTLSQDEVSAAGLSPGVYQQRRDGTITSVSGQGGDRLSAGQARQVESYYQEIAAIDNISSELGRFEQMIQGGQLVLNPASNTIGGVRNALGISSENSRNLAEFRSTLERVRNDSLRLNNGVQTEGDAKRAWDELVANLNDDRVVLRQLRRIDGINARARQFRQQRIDAIEGGGRQQPAQQAPRVRFTPTQAQQSAWSSTSRSGSVGSRTNPVLINAQDPTTSFGNVRSGQYFITPDGQIRGPKP